MHDDARRGEAPHLPRLGALAVEPRPARLIETDHWLRLHLLEQGVVDNRESLRDRVREIPQRLRGDDQAVTLEDPGLALERDVIQPLVDQDLDRERERIAAARQRTSDKSVATFKELVGDYRGTIVADALSTHAAGARDGRASCSPAAGRTSSGDSTKRCRIIRAPRALAWIGALYEIDRRGDGDVARVGELRRADAPPILADLRSWLFERVGDTHLSIGKACAYTLGIWDRLTRFVDDARIPLDNNATERAIRGPVVGRKNHNGSKSRRGTQVAATMYSILETAKLHGIDPAKYLDAAVIGADRGVALKPWEFA